MARQSGATAWNRNALWDSFGGGIAENVKINELWYEAGSYYSDILPSHQISWALACLPSYQVFMVKATDWLHPMDLLIVFFLCVWFCMAPSQKVGSETLSQQTDVSAGMLRFRAAAVYIVTGIHTDRSDCTRQCGGMMFSTFDRFAWHLVCMP